MLPIQNIIIANAGIVSPDAIRHSKNGLIGMFGLIGLVSESIDVLLVRHTFLLFPGSHSVDFQSDGVFKGGR